MDGTLSRRGFLGLAPCGLGALAFGSVRAAEAPALHPEFPGQDPALVREVVAKAHTDLEAVTGLVEASPALAKAAWDWGFGDWESALGAASHMGRRDIADVLIAHGARPDLFTHAALGHLAVVRAAIDARPGIQRIRGPHGITLLQHARNGGEPAEAVVAYLEEVGDADLRATGLELDEAMKKRYLGRYVFGPAEDDALEVLTDRRGNLSIRRGERFGRVLNRVEDHGFAPVGAPAVRVRFTVRDGEVVSLTVHDPHPLVTARRVS